jgi:hypothetical protein
VNTRFFPADALVIARPVAARTPPGRATRTTLPSTHRVEPGCASSLGRHPGELTVVHGRAWLTCRDDLRDHVLHAGERTFLPRGHFAVLSPFDKGEHLLLRWRPDDDGSRTA